MSGIEDVGGWSWLVVELVLEVGGDMSHYEGEEDCRKMRACGRGGDSTTALRGLLAQGLTTPGSVTPYIGHYEPPDRFPLWHSPILPHRPLH